MMWTVSYAEHARQDLRGIYEYISDSLLEPVTARNQTNRIMDAADSLAHMPLRVPFVRQRTMAFAGVTDYAHR